ncbi:ROK family transcriptional regulator [Emticicia sp.]|uniref:ROK family transcriptional regulator n=1 Tax=Emticicia sp. TaxID=1930953 RepID=UPI003750197D
MIETLVDSEIELSIKESVIDIKKSKQKKGILSELYFNNMNTIAELAQTLHISIPSITALIEELVEERWIVETGFAISKQGRRPAIYEINPSEKFVLVLDINTHDTKVSVLNLKNEIIFTQTFDLQLKNNPSFLDTLFSLVDKIMEQKLANGKQIIALGVSIPGLVNKNTGINFTYNSLNSKDKSLGKLIEEHFSLPVSVVNDSKATAFGEYRFGLAKGKSHVLSINVDWGVGLGIVINGEIFDGASGFAGELGHIQVNPEGILCYCGKVGCLDTITSASSLLKNIKEGLRNGQISKLGEYKDNLEDINLEMVIDAAQQGDAFSIDIIHTIGLELGKGLSIAVHLFNPQIIIIDGVLSKAQKLIVNPIEHAINKYCLSDFKEDLSIEISQLGDNAKIYGVHAYVVENLLKAA